MSNRTHSDESRKKMSDTAKKIDHSGRNTEGVNQDLKDLEGPLKFSSNRSI